MNKLKMIIGATIFILTNATAQDVITSKNVKITNSNPYEVIDSRDKNYFVTEDGLLSIKIQGGKIKEYIFQTFSGPKFNETSRKVVVLEGEEYNPLYFKSAGFYKIGGHLYHIYSFYDKPNTTERLYAREVDVEKGGFEGKAKLLFSVDEKLSGSSFSQFQLDLSEDKTKIIARFKYLDESKINSQNIEKFGLAVFDEKLELIWDNDVKMSGTEDMVYIEDFTVDSRGNGYFLLKKLKEAPSRKVAQDPDNYTLSILKVTEEGAVNESLFTIGDNIIDNVLIKENANGDIVCAGYYRKPKKFSIDGVFVSVMTSDGALTKPSLHEFSLDFIKQYNKTSERADKKLQKQEDSGDLGMNNLRMRRIVSLSDGSILLTGEIFYITTSTDSKGNTHTTYHYNDIILSKINMDGEVEWMKKIPKRSTSSSFRQFNSDDYIYVTIIDNPINAELTEEETPKNARPIAVVAYRIDIESGSHEYLTLFSLDKINDIAVYQFNLYRLIPITDKEFAVELYIKKKQDMMFKIDFEE